MHNINALAIISFIIVIALNIDFGNSISNSGSNYVSYNSNQTAEILWNLSNFAVQSRQNYPQYYRPVTNQIYPVNYLNHGEYPTYGKYYHYKKYPNYLKGQNYGSYAQGGYPIYEKYPVYDKYPINEQYQQNYATYPHYPGYPYKQYNQQQENGLFPLQQSFMNALESIARNDDLHCVPKLLCEVTSGTLSGSRQSQFQLPFNVNMDSLIGLLAAFNGVETSPVLMFGKAALLGYASKGHPGRCNFAYPECPSDPDKLVQYLNNHNGGFFRFFNGVNKNTYAPNHHYNTFANIINNYGNPYYQKSESKAEERILNNKESTNFIKNSNDVKFPLVEDYANRPSYYNSQTKGLKFPTDDQVNANNDFRKPKELSFNIYNYNQFVNNREVLDFQKPLPNHKASPMIFPDRTGTGDLRLDPDELTERPLRFSQYTQDYGRRGKNLIFPSQ